MSTLLEKLERPNVADIRRAMVEYVGILTKGDEAAAGDENRLFSLIRTLGFDVDAAREHAAALAEVARLGQIREEMKDSTVTVSRIDTQLRRLRLQYPFLFLDPSGEPLELEVSLHTDSLPRRIDSRLLAIDRGQFFNEKTLERDYGFDGEVLRKAMLPRIGSDDAPRYYGAVIAAWAWQARKYLRSVQRRELEGTLICVDPRVDRADPRGSYRLDELKKTFGIDPDSLNGFGIQRLSAHEIRGSELRRWAGLVEKQNADVKAQLEAMDAEDREEEQRRRKPQAA